MQGGRSSTTKIATLFNAAQPGVGRVHVLGSKKLQEEFFLAVETTMTTFGLCLDLGLGVVIRVWNGSGCLQMGGGGGDRRVPRPGVRLGYPRLGDSTPFSSLFG